MKVKLTDADEGLKNCLDVKEQKQLTTTFKSNTTRKMVTKNAGWGVRNASNVQQLKLLQSLVKWQGGLKPSFRGQLI